MLKRLFTHAAAVVVGAMALVVGMSTFAYAGDTAEYVTVGGINRGLITHYDRGDYFEVCDVYADGEGVRGYLDKRIAPGAPWYEIKSADDGGGAGCDWFQHNVVETVPQDTWDNYRLRICWQQYCETDPFHE